MIAYPISPIRWHAILSLCDILFYYCQLIFHIIACYYILFYHGVQTLREYSTRYQRFQILRSSSQVSLSGGVYSLDILVPMNDGVFIVELYIYKKVFKNTFVFLRAQNKLFNIERFFSSSCHKAV